MAERTSTTLASWKKTAKVVIKKLERNNMEGYWAASRADAIDIVRSWLHNGDSVTWGGSETFTESGMKAALVRASTYRMLDRTRATTEDEKRAMWQARTTADWFFMSANALTLNGELVNIDGNSDRCSLLLHGVCPLNAERLHTSTPCELTGACIDCHARKCMCCNVVVTRHSRHPGRIKVVLIGEELGY